MLKQIVKTTMPDDFNKILFCKNRMRHFICTGLERTMYNFFQIPLWKNSSLRKKRIRQMAKRIKIEHTLVNTRTTLKFFTSSFSILDKFD